ncbi:MAG: hypothetical protein RIK87_21260 [Fuerstiella sp.]
MHTDTVSQTISMPWILRRDLEVFPADDDDVAWTIKDPVRLSYFRVESEELAFLQQLDGRQSLSDAIARLQQRFPDTEFSEFSLKTFLATAVRAGLLVPLSVGYGAQLAAAAKAARSSAVYRKLFSLISHRFRGIDPTALLNVLDDWLGWIFHPRTLRAAGIFVLMAAVLVLTRWSQLTAELPAISELLTGRNLLVLGGTVACVKVLHELGHGLTCRHYGGECHELGCILVGFLPLLYCDVSDSWLQRHPRHRIHVAAAGIAVELFLAAVFGMLWIASVPGVLHSFFLNVMLVCSLNTVLVNGNPLLRYDGYYVLSDLLRIPNLGAEARSTAVSWFDHIVLGLTAPRLTMLSGLRRYWLPLFGVASMVYRLVITATILMVIHAALKPLRLESITLVLAVSVGLGLGMSWLIFFRQRLSAVRQNAARSGRAVVGIAVLMVLTGVGLFWPLPYSIEAPFSLSPGVCQPVFVSAAGYIDPQARTGDSVRQNQILAELTNPSLRLSVARTEGELRLNQARLAHLQSTRSESSAAAGAIPAAEQAVQNAKARLQTLKQKQQRLTIRSPADGIVFPPRYRTPVSQSPLQQQFWSGWPLDPANQSVWLPEQTLLCWIGQQTQIRAIAYVSQEHIDFVQEDAAAVLEFTSLPGNPWHGKVVKVANAADEVAPPELRASGMLATKGENESLAETMFTAQIQLQSAGRETGTSVEHQQLSPLYATGYVRIRCRPTSLAARLWRLLSHTFAFEI